MFIFCLSVTTAFTLALGRYLEIFICFRYFERFAHGLHIEAYHSAIRDLSGYIVTLMCLLTASIYSGIQYFSKTSGSDANDSYLPNSTSTYNVTNDTITTEVDSSHHRFIADYDAMSTTKYVSDTPDYIPIWLLLGAVSASCAWFLFIVVYFIINKEKKRYVLTK